jgi:hypothetical protein
VGPDRLELSTHGLKVLSLRECNQPLAVKEAGHTHSWLPL